MPVSGSSSGARGGPYAAVLDESVTNQRIFRNVLGKGGFQGVALYEQPHKLIEQLREERLDLLVGHKQILMPNDFQVLEEIRGLERDYPLPILVTAYQFTKDEAIAAIQHGADDLIILPFTPDQLMQKVAGVTNGMASNLEDFR